MSRSQFAAAFGLGILAVLVVILLFALIVPNFVRVKSAGEHSASGMAPPPMANQGYDASYRDPTRAAGGWPSTEMAMAPEDIGSLPGNQGQLASDADWNKAHSASAASDDGRALAGLPNIDNWLLPKAYAADNAVDEKYLIRNGTLEIKLDKLDAGQSAATAIAAKHSGSITNTSIVKDGAGYRSGSVTLRIPAENFNQAWAELLAIPGAEVLSQSIVTQDVGGEYVSAVSRMKALAAEQATLQKMLEEALAVQRSRGLGEAYSVLLDTQKRLSEVTAEIQGVEDRVSALADQITRSTITLHLSENPQIPVSQPDTFNWGLGNTFNAAVRDLMVGVRGFVNGVVYFIVTLQWIWWLLAFFAARWAWRYVKRLLAREKAASRAAANVPPPPPAGSAN